MENDLISRSALLGELQEELEFDTPSYTEEQNKFVNTGLRIAVRNVKRQPAVDAVPVVRCKDCNGWMQFSVPAVGHCSPLCMTTDADDYCAWGIRR